MRGEGREGDRRSAKVQTQGDMEMEEETRRHTHSERRDLAHIDSDIDEGIEKVT